MARLPVLTIGPRMRYVIYFMIFILSILAVYCAYNIYQNKQYAAKIMPVYKALDLLHQDLNGVLNNDEKKNDSIKEIKRISTAAKDLKPEVTKLEVRTEETKVLAQVFYTTIDKLVKTCNEINEAKENINTSVIQYDKSKTDFEASKAELKKLIEILPNR